MKTIFKIILLVLALSFSFQSCQNDQSSLTQRTNAKQLEFIGVEHNNMLNDAYLFLSTSKSSMAGRSNTSNKAALEQFLIAKIKGNVKYPESSNKVGINYVKEIFANSSQKLGRLSYSNNYELGEREKMFLDKLDEILSVSEFNNPSVIEEIKNLEKDIENENNLTEEKLVILFSATSIAKYSYTYWSQNIEKWEQLGKDESKNINAKTGPAGNIAKADVAGGVAGAVGALAVNVIVGPGQVAYGGAIVGGAVTGSVYQAVAELLDWIW
jgi:hypothetical protein